MTPISALAILFCIYAVSELIAQKTKAIFSTVLSIAILLLAGFWSGILPRTLIDDAQITGFGNIIAGLLIVSLGTTIDFAELRRQWKVVVTALCGVCGAVAAIVLIGRPFIGSEMAIAGAPIFAGGSAATLIMTSTLKEMNLTTAATFCIVLYVTQKFIGVPIASLLLRRTARLIRDDAVLVERKRRGVLDAGDVPHDVLAGFGVEVRRPVLLLTHGLFALPCTLLTRVLACQSLVGERLRQCLPVVFFCGDSPELVVDE